MSQPNARVTPTYTFTPPIVALLTSPLSHSTRPPTRAQLASPPTLPARADPTSEEARLLGPLTPQRIKAIKRRYFNEQISKLRAPIAVRLRRKDGQPVKDEHLMLKYVGLGTVDLAKGQRVLGELELKAQIAEGATPRLPRRLQSPEQRASKGVVPPRIKQEVADDQRRILSPSSKNSKWHLPKTLTPRLLRRRFQEILTNSPILVVEQQQLPSTSSSPSPTSSIDKPRPAVKTPFTFSVAQSPFARGSVQRHPEMSAEDQWWEQQEPPTSALAGKGKQRRPAAGKSSPEPTSV